MSIDRMQHLTNLAGVVGLLRKKERLRVNPKYKYDVRGLIMSLNNHSIDHLKEEFLANKNHIKLATFLQLLQDCIDCAPENKLLVFYQLVRLFEEIDIDNSYTVEWKEFMEYLSDCEWVAQTKADQATKAGQQVLYHAFRENAKFRKHPIKKIVEVDRLGLACLLDKNNRLSSLALDKSKRDNGDLSLLNVDSSKVLSLDYCEEDRLFGVLLVSRKVHFIEEGEMQKQTGLVQLSGNEIEIKYLAKHGVWLLESLNCEVQFFSAPVGGRIDKKMVFRPHTEPLTSLRQIANPLVVVTSSMDGLIRLWQIGTAKLLIELDLLRQKEVMSEKKGVKGTACFSKGITSYICSWMFTSEIFIWMPSISLSKPYVGELRGHLGVVQDCVFVAQGELVSIDSKRSLKVWSLQRFQCLQNMVLQEANSSLFSLTSKPYLLTYSKLINFYRVKMKTKADLASDIYSTVKRNALAPNKSETERLIALQFSPYYLCLIIVTFDDIRVVDVNSETTVFKQTVSIGEQYTSFAMKGERRFYVSTSASRVHQFKVNRYIDCFGLPPEDEIKFMHYHEGMNVLLIVVERVNCSAVLVYFGAVAEEIQKIKDVQFEQTNLLQFHCSQDLHQLFLLSLKGTLTVWDFDKLIIMHRVEILQCLPTQKQICAMLVHEASCSVVVVTQASVAVLHFSEGSVRSMSVIEQQVSASEYVSAHMQLHIGELPLIKGQKGNFTRDSRRHTILLLADKTGNLHFLVITDLLGESPPPIPMKGKMTLIKEKRVAHLKPVMTPENVEKMQTQWYLLSSEHVQKVERVGGVLGKYFCFTKDGLLLVLDVDGVHQMEWNLAEGKARLWQISYNELDDVLARLAKTQQALQSIQFSVKEQHKIDFLIAKYLQPEELLTLREERKISSRVSKFINSDQQIQPKPQPAIKEEQINMFEGKQPPHSKFKIRDFKSRQTEIETRINRVLSQSKIVQRPIMEKQVTFGEADLGQYLQKEGIVTQRRSVASAKKLSVFSAKKRVGSAVNLMISQQLRSKLEYEEFLKRINSDGKQEARKKAGKRKKLEL